MLSFRCATCGEEHSGIPTFGWDFPEQYFDVPENRREPDVFLTTDTCVIADRFFFVKGCLEIPVVGHETPFSWGVWVSLSEKNFFHFQELLGVAKRSHHSPFFAWLCSRIWIYPETLHLKTMIHLRDDGIRPFVELEPADHPLVVEQRTGITSARLAEIHEKMVHPSGEAGQQPDEADEVRDG